MKLIRTIGLLLLGYLLAEGVNYRINSWLYLAVCLAVAVVLLVSLCLPTALEKCHEQIEANHLSDRLKQIKPIEPKP